MAGDAGGADVKPVGVLRGEFVAVRGFDGIDPACEWWLIEDSSKGESEKWVGL